MKLFQTAERVSKRELSDNYVFQRSILSYAEASKIISGEVLEIGTGNGYGINIIAPNTTRFVTVDKCQVNFAPQMTNCVEFIKMIIPPLHNIPDNSFDFVISFQVIEHIKRDEYFVEEVHRVLKDKGKFIVATPNKKMSLTRNPWHIREYTIDELDNLLSKHFLLIEKFGVFGNEKIMQYYVENKKFIQQIMRFDIFNFQYRLPRQLLKIPYDIFNRMNRRKLLKNNYLLTSEISMDDYYIDTVSDECFDLFYVAEKSCSPKNI